MDERFDEDGLGKNDGTEGRPTYIAHEGRVFDVSESRLWAGGIHMGRHHAGADLSADIGAAPHGPEVLERYPRVGVLSKEALPGSLPPLLDAFLTRYPFFRRHPHPASVHFPIVLTFAASFFSALYAVTGEVSFDQTAFYCLTGALLFTPLAMITGLLSWWVNYMARPMRSVTIKKYLSLASLVAMVGLFFFRVLGSAGPPPVSTPSGFFYLVLVIAVSAAILTVSYYGGTLTFPLERKETNRSPDHRAS